MAAWKPWTGGYERPSHTLYPGSNRYTRLDCQGVERSRAQVVVGLQATVGTLGLVYNEVVQAVSVEVLVIALFLSDELCRGLLD